MYGDNLLIPGDGPFDWNGWGAHGRAHYDSAESAARVEDWRADVETIVALSLEPEAKPPMEAGPEGPRQA